MDNQVRIYRAGGFGFMVTHRIIFKIEFMIDLNMNSPSVVTLLWNTFRDTSWDFSTLALIVILNWKKCRDTWNLIK